MKLLFYKLRRLFKLYREEKKIKKALKDLAAGKITPNEARKAAGLPPVERREFIT